MVKKRNEVRQNIKQGLAENGEWLFGLQVAPNMRTKDEILGFMQGRSR